MPEGRYSSSAGAGVGDGWDGGAARESVAVMLRVELVEAMSVRSVCG